MVFKLLPPSSGDSGVYKGSLASITGNIYYCCAYVTGGYVKMQFRASAASYPAAAVNNANNTFISVRGAVIEGWTILYPWILGNSAYSPAPVSFRQHMVFNLTAIFGAGNEPTQAYMDSLIQSIGSYFTTYTEATTNGYIATLRDTSKAKYVNLINILGQQGSFETDNLDYWSTNLTPGTVEISNQKALFGNKALRFNLVGLGAGLWKDIVATNGDKIYCCGYANRVSGTLGNQAIRLFDANGTTNSVTVLSTSTVNNAPVNTWVFGSGIKTVINDGVRVYLYTTSSSSSCEFYLDGIIIINMTAIFGLGGEPTQVQMDEIVQRALSEGYFTEKNVVRPTDAITAGLSNQPRWSNGIKFDGLDDYFIIPSYPEIDFAPNKPFSLVISAYNTAGAFGYLYCKNYTDGTNVQMGAYLDGSNQVVCVIEGAVMTVVPVPVNKYTILTITNANGKYTAYRNTQKFDTIDSRNSTSRPYVSIGRRVNGAFLNSTVKQILVFDRELTEREILKINKYIGE